MKDKGICFDTEMVKAILADAKSQTRRVLKPQPVSMPENAYCDRYNGDYGAFTFWTVDGRMCNGQTGNIEGTCHWRCPYGVPGDRLYVKETFSYNLTADGDREGVFGYKADWPGSPLKFHFEPGPRDYGYAGYTAWKSGRFMPRWAARLWLEVTDVRVERVQSITFDDLRAEGVEKRLDDSSGSWRDRYAALWDRLNAKRGYPWASSPWVWRISFKRVEVTV